MSEQSDRIDEAIKAAAEEEDGRKRSQATRLVALAEGLELFHDGHDETYAALPVTGTDGTQWIETWPISSRGFKRWLTRRYWVAYEASPNSQALNDALNVLAGKARFEGPLRPVYVRIAGDGIHRVVIDCGDPAWTLLQVDNDGDIAIADPGEFAFVRRPGMTALPTDGSYDPRDLAKLWALINVRPADRVLVAAWLVQALRPRGPYPVLVLQGEQGTAKTTLARILRSLVDPNSVAVRTPPRDERDMMIAARNGWVVAYDNLSGIQTWVSDAICRLSTGGGFGTRTLYTDTDETLIDVQRPVILNGIEDIAVRQDLIDRTIILQLDPIPDECRRPEGALWADVERLRPALFGALLRALGHAMQRLPDIRIPHPPRMADFAIFAAAAGRAARDRRRGRLVNASRRSHLVSSEAGCPAG